MSREIKFRAWGSNGMIHWGALQRLHIRTVFDTAAPEIKLMQYTGLKDKNGKEIYEGDIVKSVSELIRPFESRGKQRTGRMATSYKAIEYRDNVAAFCIKGSALPSISQTTASRYYEVIGNIYESPELLDEGKQ